MTAHKFSNKTEVVPKNDQRRCVCSWNMARPLGCSVFRKRSDAIPELPICLVARFIFFCKVTECKR
jgi:hypothetical protein